MISIIENPDKSKMQNTEIKNEINTQFSYCIYLIVFRGGETSLNFPDGSFQPVGPAATAPQLYISRAGLLL